MTDKIIGSRLVRGFALAWAALAGLWVARSGGVVDAWHEVAISYLTLWLVVSFAAVVLSSRRLYDLWVPIAEVVSSVMVRLIFAVVYLVVFPPFALWSRVARRLRRRPSDSYWAPRPEPGSPAELFDGMD